MTRSPCARWWGWLLAALALGGPAAGEPARGDLGALALGVAPFEVDAPPGQAVPDLATLLADRLATKGIEPLVGPSQLGAEADADADPAAVRAWAARAGVEVVVVGRTTRIGSQLSVDVRLRDGDTGEVARTFVQEIARPEDLEEAVEGLASRVIGGALELLGGSAPSPTPVSAGPGAAPEAGGGELPFGFGAWDSDEPLAIESEELEAIQKEGRRRLIFERNVRVRQGELRISADRLEAIYPENASRPDRLVARGSVRLVQGRQSARCEQALYDRVRQRLSCQGQAHFQDGDNRLSGEVVEIDLRDEKVTVRGGASVLIQPGALDGTRDGDEAS